MQNVEVDACRVVHHIGIVFAGKDVAGSAHVGCELIDFVEAAVDDMSHEIWITKITDDEVISVCLAEPREFKIGAANPKALPLKPPDEVVTNEATSPTN